MLTIELSQNYLWNGKDYVIWPICLARAIKERVYTLEEIRHDVFGRIRGMKGFRENRPRDARGVSKVDETTVRIRGVGLFEETERDKYRLSADAAELAEFYRRSNTSIDWKTALAKIVAKYDVRVRTVLFYLGKLGYALNTGNSSHPAATPLWKTVLASEREKVYLYEKTLEYLCLDLLDFTDFLKNNGTVLQLDPIGVRGFEDAACEYISRLFGERPDHADIAEDALPAKVRFAATSRLVDVLRSCKIVLFHVAETRSDPISRQAELLARQICYYYWTRSSLKTELDALSKAANGILESVQRIVDLLKTPVKQLEWSLEAGSRLDRTEGPYLDINALRQLISARKAKQFVFNELLERYKKEIVGPYILEKIRSAGIDTALDLKLVGTDQRFINEPPAIRNCFSVTWALILLRDIDVLVWTEQGWRINPSLASARLNDGALVDNLFIRDGEAVIPSEDYSLLALAEAYALCLDPKTGYAKASKLARTVCEKLGITAAHNDYLCKLIRQLRERGDVQIESTREGLPQYGSGLCDDPKQRLIKLAIRPPRTIREG